MQAGSEREKV